jgi:O-antigen/teichoic acid export membrane protein
VFICYSAVFGKWLVAEGLHSILPRMTFVAMITNIAAILVLVPAVGLVGVALATLLTQLVPAALFFASDARLRAHLRRALLPGACGADAEPSMLRRHATCRSRDLAR